jgi:hypothetical protein
MMSKLLDEKPFAPRDDRQFLAEMNDLSRWHLNGCPEFARIWPDWRPADRLDQLPFLHVGLFKHLLLKTSGEGIVHARTLTSSTTTGASPSRVSLDARSSELQAASSIAILRDVAGEKIRPLLVIEDARSLLRRDEVSARVVAAMSLKPLASQIHFLLKDGSNPKSIDWDVIANIADKENDLLVYGFTWILWQAWGEDMPRSARAALAGKTIYFVHSGGWKKLEAMKVDRSTFDSALLRGLSPPSKVIDYYGLVEQVGVIFPLCEHGSRHVPRWGAVLARDPWTLDPLADQPGLLQFMNTLSRGAPYHSVLTEDIGRILPGPCSCGRSGQRFELIGRVPKAEVRGCANV